MTDREAMQQALEALESCTPGDYSTGHVIDPSYDEQAVEQSITALRRALEQPAQQEPVAWCPDVCPITGLPFFMWIEHHETGQRVPTYGGPYDSYTIPVRDRDGSYCRERYDHDRGGWLTDEVEDVGVQIVSDQAFVYDDERHQASEPEQPAPVQLASTITITQRDYFAANLQDEPDGSDFHDKVKAQIVGRPCPNGSTDGWLALAQFEADFRAKWRFMRADAMLKARAA